MQAKRSSIFNVVAAGTAAVALCAVGGCTKVVEADHPPPPPAAPDSPPAPPRPRPAAATPSHAWASSASPSPPPSTASRPDAAPEPVPPDTLNGDPKGLKREVIGAALQEAMPSLAPCLQAPGEAASVGLSFEASPEGHAENVKVTGGSPAAERCVAGALARVKLPPFEGKPVAVQFPLTVYRPAPAPAPPPQPAAPAPPPLFVNP